MRTKYTAWFATRRWVTVLALAAAMAWVAQVAALQGWSEAAAIDAGVASVALAAAAQDDVVGQETQDLPQDPAGDIAAPTEDQEPERSVDLSALPAVPDGLTGEEEQALQLVEQILAEQRMLVSGQNFVYDPGARRDPFRSLLALRQRELNAPVERPAGLPGFLVAELELQATARFQGRWQAMVLALDGRTYFVEVGAGLYDGRVVEISDGVIVFEQEVEDMLGARSTRRFVKELGTEG